ncbi:MAG: R3H domain-containing nucleic acid-binding protein [Patescibacteria group bacterium]
MEQQLSDVLDNILGLLLLEGSYEINETEEGFFVSIDTNDAGRLIGVRGESLESLQLIINQIMSRKIEEEGFKRVILDVSNWRKQKEEDLKKQAEVWGKQVLEEGHELVLEPQSPWQRRVVHMGISEMDGLVSESVGEGRDRHIVIKLKTNNLPSAEQKSRQRRGSPASPSESEAGPKAAKLKSEKSS